MSSALLIFQVTTASSCSSYVNTSGVLLQDGAPGGYGDAPGGARAKVLPRAVYLLPSAILHHMRHTSRGKCPDKQKITHLTMLSNSLSSNIGVKKVKDYVDYRVSSFCNDGTILSYTISYSKTFVNDYDKCPNTFICELSVIAKRCCIHS